MREMILKKLRNIVSLSDYERLECISDQDLIEEWYDIVYAMGYQHCLRSMLLSMKDNGQMRQEMNKQE